jgi:hypothetical protein
MGTVSSKFMLMVKLCPGLKVPDRSGFTWLSVPLSSQRDEALPTGAKKHAEAINRIPGWMRFEAGRNGRWLWFIKL